MAKVPFTKLKLKTDDSVKQVKINEEITIEVKQYLPVQEKLALISRVVEYAHMEDANYSNPVKAEVYRDLEVVYAYTNISFTDKQKEETPKLYDMLVSSGVLKQIIEAIPEEEYSRICCGVWNSIESIYKYINSVVGIIDTINQGQKDAVVDMETVQKGLESLQNNSFLKELIPVLGLE